MRYFYPALGFVCAAALICSCAALSQRHEPEAKKAHSLRPPFPLYSFEQAILIDNITAEKVKLVPSHIKYPYISIAPKQPLMIQFTVEARKFFDPDGGIAEYAKVSGSPYVSMRGTEAFVRFQTAGGETRDYTVALGNCWFDESAAHSSVHLLKVGMENPDAKTPHLNLCE
ncbi:MAG: hypothetical protein ACT4NX_07125 [Deltaproteobacteria bacterium]